MTGQELLANIRQNLNTLRDPAGRLLLLGFRDSPDGLAWVSERLIDKLLAEQEETLRKAFDLGYTPTATESIMLQLLMSSGGLSHLLPKGK